MIRMFGKENSNYKFLDENVINDFIHLYNKGGTMVDILKVMPFGRKKFYSLIKEYKDIILSKEDIKEKEINRIKDWQEEYSSNHDYSYGLITFISNKENI